MNAIALIIFITYVIMSVSILSFSFFQILICSSSLVVGSISSASKVPLNVLDLPMVDEAKRMSESLTCWEIHLQYVLGKFAVCFGKVW